MENQSVDSTTGGSQRNWPIITAVMVAVVAVCGLFVWVIIGQIQQQSPTANDPGSKLYAVLGNAAQQKKIGISMYRATYATQADADARANIGTQLSSVSELDTATHDYRSAFAHDLFDKPKFDIGRCVGKDTYNDNYQNKNDHPNSLAEANEALKTRVFKITEPLVFIPCPYLGIIPQSTPDLAVARLSDGVFPVTLSQQQADNWTAKIKAANLFSVKDEGIVERDGKQLRKLSFAPQGDNVNQRLYDIFYEVAEIEKAKRELPDSSWQFGFISVNPLNTGGVGGYYLIDEQRNLPVYSELYGTNVDKDSASSKSASRNIARTKQLYRYPEQLTITPQTPLEFLE